MKSIVGNLKSKERRGSTGSLEDYRKKKREVQGEERECSEDILKKSNKMLRSPIKRDGKEGDLAEILKEWREEMKREMREGIRGIREDIRKMAEEQKEEIKREVEEIRGEIAVREENWRKERDELRERLERMENKLEREKGKGGKGREVYEEEILR